MVKNILFTLLFAVAMVGCNNDDELNEPIDPFERKGYTYIPDDNFEKELIKLGYDYVLDDYVLTDKINDISGLYVSDLEIKD